MNYTHKNIRKFEVEGVIKDDSDIIRLKDHYILMLCDYMRELGWVRRADIDPDFSLEYNPDSTYNFKLTLYAIYVGRAKSQWIDSVDKNNPVPITQKNKSVEHSME